MMDGGDVFTRGTAVRRQDGRVGRRLHPPRAADGREGFPRTQPTLCGAGHHARSASTHASRRGGTGGRSGQRDDSLVSRRTTRRATYRVHAPHAQSRVEHALLKPSYFNSRQKTPLANLYTPRSRCVPWLKKPSNAVEPPLVHIVETRNSQLS